MMAVPFTPSARAALPVYRAGEINHCPGCGRSQWIVGRLSCECAFCACALPLATEGRGSGTVLYRNLANPKEK